MLFLTLFHAILTIFNAFFMPFHWYFQIKLHKNPTPWLHQISIAGDHVAQVCARQWHQQQQLIIGGGDRGARRRTSDDNGDKRWWRGGDNARRIGVPVAREDNGGAKRHQQRLQREPAHLRPEWQVKRRGIYWTGEGYEGTVHSGTWYMYGYGTFWHFQVGPASLLIFFRLLGSFHVFKSTFLEFDQNDNILVKTFHTMGWFE